VVSTKCSVRQRRNGATTSQISSTTTITAIATQAIPRYCQLRSSAATAKPPPMSTMKKNTGGISDFQCGCLCSTTSSPRDSRLSG
jgi:hypothetical protein